MQPRVLLVDDDIELCKMAALGLEQRRFLVRWMTSGQAAASAISEQDYDVLVADVIMEDMDGLRLCRHATDRCPRLPVVLITAHGSLDVAIHAIRAGAGDLITKPFGMEELAQAIHRVTLERRQEGPVLGEAVLQQSATCGGLIGQVMLNRFQLLAQISTADVPITEDELPLSIRGYRSRGLALSQACEGAYLSLEELEYSYIEQVLTAFKGNKSQAAKLLGIDRATLYRKLARAKERSAERKLRGEAPREV